MEFLRGIGGLYFLIVIVLAAMAVEFVAPWRKTISADPARWLRNAIMNFYGIILLGLLPWIAGFGGAVIARENGIGILNTASAPLWLAMAVTVLVADLLAFAQHRALHRWYVLWRTHRAHHSDVIIDATTSLRFHPFETLFRALVEIGVVFALGLPPEGMLLAYAVFVVVNVYTHFNVNIPLSLEKRLAMLLVTPRIHRLHHSVDTDHQNANFGTIFTVWDRLGGTYLGPEHLRDTQSFGVCGAEAMEAETFGNLALDPFRKRPAEHAPDGVKAVDPLG